MNDLLYIQKQLNEKLSSYIESLRNHHPLREDEFSGKYTLNTSQNNITRGEIFLSLSIDADNLFYDCDRSIIQEEMLSYINVIILEWSSFKLNVLYTQESFF